MSPGAMETTHQARWWSHAAIYTAWVVYIGVGFSKMMHIILAPANLLLKPARPRGALAPMGDFETLDALKQQIKDDFQAQSERASRRSVEESVVDELIRSNDF